MTPILFIVGELHRQKYFPTGGTDANRHLREFFKKQQMSWRSKWFRSPSTLKERSSRPFIYIIFRFGLETSDFTPDSPPTFDDNQPPVRKGVRIVVQHRRVQIGPVPRYAWSMDIEGSLPDGWSVWHAEPAGQLVLTFRADVFDGKAYPPECLPTIVVRDRPHRPRRPIDRRGDDSGNAWYTTLFLEPTIVLREERAPSHDDAVETALAFACRFVDGDLGYRAAYQVPRERYLDRLDDLILREP